MQVSFLIFKSQDTETFRDSTKTSYSYIFLQTEQFRMKGHSYVMSRYVDSKDQQTALGFDLCFNNPVCVYRQDRIVCVRLQGRFCAAKKTV